jgi:hypothetical protein
MAVGCFILAFSASMYYPRPTNQENIAAGRFASGAGGETKIQILKFPLDLRSKKYDC